MAFQKGVSGNPEGRRRRSREEMDLIKACRVKVPEALDKLEVLMHSENESIALKAAITILERAYGKPRQEVDMQQTIEAADPTVIQLVGRLD